ncbi:MAG TPA: hypothetical protein VHW91_01700 [Candidatus Dormibacteraeota bacterium]|nr:hypothetical protein [Candidatus Dormibacteraeota bacterium]
MSNSVNSDTMTVGRDEYEFMQAIVEAVDDFLNAPYPRFRDESLEWLTEMLGDDLGDEEPKERQARIDDADCEDCRKVLLAAFAWKERRHRIQPAPVLTLHRHGDKPN